MNVIPFRPSRPYRTPPPVQPPRALGERWSRPDFADEAVEEEVDERLRMRQNLAAMAVVVLIVVAGTWLIERLQTYARLQACIDAGHQSCLQLIVHHDER